MRYLSKIIPKNLILLVSSKVADPILILVKCNSFLHEKIIYFVLSALIQIRFDVSQLLTLLSSWLRVNVNSRAFLFSKRSRNTRILLGKCSSHPLLVSIFAIFVKLGLLVTIYIFFKYLLLLSNLILLAYINSCSCCLRIKHFPIRFPRVRLFNVFYKFLVKEHINNNNY